MSKWYYFNTHVSDKGNQVIVMSDQPADKEAAKGSVTLANGEEFATAGTSRFGGSQSVEFAFGVLDGKKNPKLALGELVIEADANDDGRVF